MPNFLFHIDVAGVDNLEHISALAAGFLDDLRHANLKINRATMTSHTNFANPSTVDLNLVHLGAIVGEVPVVVVVEKTAQEVDNDEDDEKNEGEKKHAKSKPHAKK